MLIFAVGPISFRYPNVYLNEFNCVSLYILKYITQADCIHVLVHGSIFAIKCDKHPTTFLWKHIRPSGCTCIHLYHVYNVYQSILCDSS